MIINNQIKEIDNEIKSVERWIEYDEERQKELKEKQKELERKLEELKIAREAAIEESESSLTIGQCIGLFALNSFLIAGAKFASLPEETKEELCKRVARNMFNRAVKGEITRPYDEEEIQFMMEHLK